MAQLKEIKRKIKSVQNTEKTTKAMKLVSTAKLKRAEEAAKRAKAYASKLNEMMHKIGDQVASCQSSGFESPYFNPVKNGVIDIMFVTADKGLCGGFNAQTIKMVKNLRDKYIAEGKTVRLRCVGKKGAEFFRFKGIALHDCEIGVSASPTHEKAVEIINRALEDYLSGECEQIILIHNGYKSMIAQEIQNVTLLPFGYEVEEKNASSVSMVTIEPSDSDEEVLNALIKKYIENNLYFALINSLAAEHSARMQAMDAASKNAKQMVKQLTLKYNKARQEAITTELVEIISGMEAIS